MEHNSGPEEQNTRMIIIPSPPQPPLPFPLCWTRKQNMTYWRAQGRLLVTPEPWQGASVLLKACLLMSRGSRGLASSAQNGPAHASPLKTPGRSWPIYRRGRQQRQGSVESWYWSFPLLLCPHLLMYLSPQNSIQGEKFTFSVSTRRES